MSKQKADVALVDEIIDQASGLPLEYQDCLLAIAKGMAFTRDHICEEIDHETN